MLQDPGRSEAIILVANKHTCLSFLLNLNTLKHNFLNSDNVVQPETINFNAPSRATE